MSGFVFVMGPCFMCKKIFTFNPRYVPSFRVKGEREPICAGCLAVVNERRKEAGDDPFHIHPEAYEPLPEEEL